MILSEDKVIKLIERGVSDQIALARKKARHRNMHVTGKGLVDYLEVLDTYETEAQRTLKKKLAKSNRANFSFILRPTDKIFTAKGGAINYNLPQEKVNFFKENISEIADGLDIKKYLKKKVKKEYIVDPNGVIFVDIDEDGRVETYVIPTSEILWYSAKGNTVNAIIFEFYDKDREENDRLKFIEKCNSEGIGRNGELPNGVYQKRKYFRVIDDKTDRIFVIEDKKMPGTAQSKNISLDPNSTISNYFGFVPALILGDVKDNNTGLFESIIEDLLDDADIMLRRMSVMTIHELSHLYPRYWAYAQACTQCNGEGTIDYVSKKATETTEAVIESKTCPSCGGDGAKKRTNPSDETVVPLPMGDDPVIQKLMGFESPDLETARFYEGVVKSHREEMFRAMWGTTYEVGGKRETATGRFLDAQPVNDRLGDMSDTFSKIHKFLLDCYGVVILRNPKYESSVTYGRRYVFEGPDDILTKYVEVSRENVSDMTKLDLQIRYIESEYQDDPIERKKRLKLLRIEPFPALSCEKVVAIQGLPEKEVVRKLYFAEWVNTLSDSELIFDTDEKLKSKLNTYINNKTLKNESI